MGKPRSELWNLTCNELQEIKDSCKNITEMCEKLGINAHNGSSRTLYRVAESLNFDLKFEKVTPRQVTPRESIFVKDSSATRKLVRTEILRRDLIPYVCKDCGLPPFWKGKPITLQLEHINGIGNDNRLVNLCWLCPNCHSQTPTFSGRNKKKG